MYRKYISHGAAVLLALTLSVSAWAEQTWTVNFKDSDIQEVIKFVADVTGRTVVIDPRVRGNVKVISSKPLTESELIHLFRTVLEMHDFSVVEVGDVLRVIRLNDARSSPVPVVDRGSREKGYLTQVIQLQNIAAAQVLPSIRPLVPQHSHLSAYDPSNAIIITDSAENIERIRDLIERLDQSATPTTEVIELRYATAQDMVQVLDSLDKSEQGGRSPRTSINMIADQRNNAILLTGEDLQRQRIKTLIARLDRPRVQAGNVRVVYLSYADASTVAETLTRVMDNLYKLSPGGRGDGSAATVEADEDTNALLITASGDDLQTLLEVVERLDIRRAQVLVEAIIAEVSESVSRDLGIQWMFRNTAKGAFGSTLAGSASGGTGAVGAIGGAAFGAADNPDSIESLTALAGALGGTTGQILGVVGTHDNYDFLAVLNALEQDGKTNILSTPSLLTMDNHEANFMSGQNIPILTGSAATTGGTLSPFQTFQRQDVGIKLTVKPQVNEGNTVLMDIIQEVSGVAPGSSGAGGFITNQRRIETQALAASGEMIVLGGLIEERADIGEQRVPILGSIPVVGRLFRSTSRGTERTNLMIFLKATVLRDDETLTGATAEKYHYIRDQQLNQQNAGFMRPNHRRLPVLPDLDYYQLQPQLPDDVIMTPSAQEQVEQTSDEANSNSSN